MTVAARRKSRRFSAVSPTALRGQGQSRSGTPAPGGSAPGRKTGPARGPGTAGQQRRRRRGETDTDRQDRQTATGSGAAGSERAARRRGGEEGDAGDAARSAHQRKGAPHQTGAQGNRSTPTGPPRDSSACGGGAGNSADGGRRPRANTTRPKSAKDEHAGPDRRTGEGGRNSPQRQRVNAGAAPHTETPAAPEQRRNDRADQGSSGAGEGAGTDDRDERGAQRRGRSEEPRESSRHRTPPKRKERGRAEANPRGARKPGPKTEPERKKKTERRNGTSRRERQPGQTTSAPGQTRTALAPPTATTSARSATDRPGRTTRRTAAPERRKEEQTRKNHTTRRRRARQNPTAGTRQNRNQQKEKTRNRPPARPQKKHPRPHTNSIPHRGQKRNRKQGENEKKPKKKTGGQSAKTRQRERGHRAPQKPTEAHRSAARGRETRSSGGAPKPGRKKNAPAAGRPRPRSAPRPRTPGRERHTAAAQGPNRDEQPRQPTRQTHTPPLLLSSPTPPKKKPKVARPSEGGPQGSINQILKKKSKGRRFILPLLFFLNLIYFPWGRLSGYIEAHGFLPVRGSGLFAAQPDGPRRWSDVSRLKAHRVCRNALGSPRFRRGRHTASFVLVARRRAAHRPALAVYDSQRGAAARRACRGTRFLARSRQWAVCRAA